MEITVCKRIDKCLELIGDAFRTKSLDAPGLAEQLREIRTSAMKMERALKIRKEMMSKVGIEEEYQERKAKLNTPDKNNKIANRPEESWIGIPAEFEVVIKQDGKEVYNQKGMSGVISVAERIEDIDENAVITGTTQSLMFGHPLLTYFAFDQLSQEMDVKVIKWAPSIAKMVKDGKLRTEDDRRKFLLGLKKHELKSS